MSFSVSYNHLDLLVTEAWQSYETIVLTSGFISAREETTEGTHTGLRMLQTGKWYILYPLADPCPGLITWFYQLAMAELCTVFPRA